MRQPGIGPAPLAALLIVCGGAGAVAGVQMAQADDFAAVDSEPPTVFTRDDQPPVQRPDHQTNARGQTYGVATDVLEDDPDLIKAEATNGRVGYVLSADLLGPAFSSPQEASGYSAAVAARGGVTIPVYESDGATVVGEFVMSPGLVTP